MRAVGDQKFCPKCEETKHVDNFTKDAKTSDGLDIWCKSCKKTYNDSPAAKESARRWYYEGSGRSIKSSYQKSGKPRSRKKAEPYRSQVLRRKYGITVSDYEEILKNQEYKCAICKTYNPGKRRGSWPIDHDHKTGKVRGLLCWSCNSALGLLKDSYELCEKAAEYLRKSKE